MYSVCTVHVRCMYVHARTVYVQCVYGVCTVHIQACVLYCRAAEAKKQNDYVFHEKLPPMEHLEAVQGGNGELRSHINPIHYVQVQH